MCRGFSNFGGAPSKAAKMSASRLRSLCFLILLLASSWAWPLDPDKHISQYGHTAWRIQDGFFGGRGRSITQTTDGYIWVGTEAGLFRFDGVRFVSWIGVRPTRGPKRAADHNWKWSAARCLATRPS